MTTSAEARRLALALPEAVEQDHHGEPSFRVAGKIFATLWGENQMNVMLDEAGVLTAVQAMPAACSELWWGKRLRRTKNASWCLAASSGRLERDRPLRDRPDRAAGRSRPSTTLVTRQTRTLILLVRLSAVRVALDRLDADALAELLADAWERRAPARLL